MNDVLDDIERWRARGEKVAVATLVAARRSAPRPVGTKLAVSEGGEIAGSLSGGCVEPDVYEHAREVLRTGSPMLLSYGISDDLAWSVGLPCGGEIDVFVEPLGTDAPLVAEERSAVLTVISGEDAGRKEVVREGAYPDVDEFLRSGRNGVLERPGSRVFAEVFVPRPRLVVFGAVDLAESLARAAKALGWKTVVIDPRERFATAARVPSADELVAAWPEDALAQVRPDRTTAVVVVTHDDKIDVPALAAALATDAFYVGALGSRRAQARRSDLLRAAGVPDEDIQRIAAPCGLDIGGETSAETALSILAEIVATRAGRSGGPLKETQTRIHAEGVADYATS